jgi:hypothetical protein
LFYCAAAVLSASPRHALAHVHPANLNHRSLHLCLHLHLHFTCTTAFLFTSFFSLSFLFFFALLLFLLFYPSVQRPPSSAFPDSCCGSNSRWLPVRIFHRFLVCPRPCRQVSTTKFAPFGCYSSPSKGPALGTASIRLPSHPQASGFWPPARSYHVLLCIPCACQHKCTPVVIIHSW